MTVRADPSIATGRTRSLFAEDWEARRDDILDRIACASILVAGGAGTIGAAVVRAMLPLRPARIHIVDLDENGLARLTRALRADGVSGTELEFLAADIAGYPLRAHCSAAGPFDLAFDLAAVKHVRSEKSVPALLHMLSVNIVRQDGFFQMLGEVGGLLRCFTVSTDKAADPASFMGASKRLLEEVLHAAGRRGGFATSAARFANVAFSSGSLLESFVERLAARRPLAAPRDTRRFFVSAAEAAEICLIAATEEKTEILVPRAGADLPSHEMADVAGRFLAAATLRATFVDTLAEAEAVLVAGGDRYPVVLTPRDTGGEKETEIFVGAGERTSDIGLAALQGLSVPHIDGSKLEETIARLAARTEGSAPTNGADELAAIIAECVPNFAHRAGGRLDDRI